MIFFAFERCAHAHIFVQTASINAGEMVEELTELNSVLWRPARKYDQIPWQLPIDGYAYAMNLCIGALACTPDNLWWW